MTTPDAGTMAQSLKPQRGDAPASRFGSDLTARAMSGGLLALIGAVDVWIGGWLLAGFIALGCSVMSWEWRGMTAPGKGARQRRVLLAILAAGLPPLLAYGVGFPAALAAAVLLSGALIWSELGRSSYPFATGAGVFIVALAGTSFVWLRGDPAYGLATAFWIPLVVAGADMGGYFFGRLFGGPKLAPAISPNKTVSGAVGGVALAVAIGVVFALVTGVAGVALMALLSLGLAVISQAGDLTESAMKRRYAVKDVSALIPGHGGVMDRLDAMMAATLAVAAVNALRGQSVFSW